MVITDNTVLPRFNRCYRGNDNIPWIPISKFEISPALSVDINRIIVLSICVKTVGNRQNCSTVKTEESKRTRYTFRKTSKHARTHRHAKRVPSYRPSMVRHTLPKLKSGTGKIQRDKRCTQWGACYSRLVIVDWTYQDYQSYTHSCSSEIQDEAIV